MTALHPFLREHIVDPEHHSRPSSWTDHTVSFGTEEYNVVDGIPVLLSHTNANAPHREHYATDAVAFDYFEERDAATDHDEHRLRQTILRQVPTKTSSVLDVGCGRAWVADHLCKRSVTVCSLDVSLTNPRKALETVQSPHHCAVVADAFSLPFADGTFDCVISSEVIEHVPDPAAFLKELLRVLKPGGMCIISTPYNERRKFVLCIHCNNVTPLHAHLHSFTEHTLQQLSPTLKMNHEIFGNKALLHLRTYVLLRFLPYSLWRAIDSIANSLINKCSHIVCVYSKQA